MSGWILPKQVMLGATKTKKKSCGCVKGDIGVGNRILTPTFRNCRSDLKRNKRFRNEATKWHNTFSEGGSLPRKYIVAGRRKTGRKPQAGRSTASTSLSRGGKRKVNESET